MPSHLIAATCFTALLSAASAQAQTLRIRAQVEDGVVQPGEAPVLFVEFANTSDKPLEAYLPTEEELERFPSDLFDIRRDGVKLPFKNNPERHFTFPAPTSLQPGEYLLLRIPLSGLVRIPDGAETGRYTVTVHADYYRGGVTLAETPTFTVTNRLEPPASGAPVSELLARPDWKERVGEVADPALLSGVARDRSAYPIARRRALELLLAAPARDQAAKIVQDLGEVDGVLRFYAVDLVDAIEDPALQRSALIRALETPDVTLRRRAAAGIRKKGWGGDAREPLERCLERCRDALLEKRLREALESKDQSKD